jgi:hypothetical protein
MEIASPHHESSTEHTIAPKTKIGHKTSTNRTTTSRHLKQHQRRHRNQPTEISYQSSKEKSTERSTAKAAPKAAPKAAFISQIVLVADLRRCIHWEIRTPILPLL